MDKRCLSRWSCLLDQFVRCVIDLRLLVDAEFLHPELLGEDALLLFAARHGVAVALDLLSGDAAVLGHLPDVVVVPDLLFDGALAVHLLLEDAVAQDHLLGAAAVPDRLLDVAAVPDHSIDVVVILDHLLDDVVVLDHPAVVALDRL